MMDGLYKGDLLMLEERETFEQDLISFCDRELDLLGGIGGLNVLYAGGASPLWIEGLSQRIGDTGTLTALDADAERVEAAQKLLREAELAAPVRLVVGDVFRLPFAPGMFDLAYSAGLFHELDVRVRTAEDALANLVSVVRTGGRAATSDFVGSVPAVQLEDEKLQRELAWEISGAEYYGIGSSDRLVALHEALLAKVRWRILPPHPVRHLDKIALAEEEAEGLGGLTAQSSRRLREHRDALLERIKHEGYTRPATLYVEGFVIGG
jgi:SAM-dependent methyltransferase